MNLDWELTKAILDGDLGKAESLFKRGAKAAYRDLYGRHLIYSTIESNKLSADDRLRMVQLLLNNGADSELNDLNKAVSIIRLASEPSADPRILGILIDKGIEMNLYVLKFSILLSSEDLVGLTKEITYSPEVESWSLLHFAAYNGKLNLVQEIFKLPVEERGDVNDQDSVGRTSLDIAVHFDRSDVVSFLMGKGAKTNYGKAPSDLANKHVRSEVADSSKEKNGTCGSIKNIEVGEKIVSFFDSNGDLIFKIPKVHPSYSGTLYEPARSKQFSSSSPGISDVLPNSFVFGHGFMNFTIKYDSLSQQEQERIKTDIKTAYNLFRETFCLVDDTVDRGLVFYVFNNREDYKKYNNLLGLNSDDSFGVTDFNKVLTFKSPHMGSVLAHELAHVLQAKHSEPEIRNFAKANSQIIPYFVEREVRERNYKTIQVANSSMEVEKGNRSRRSIDQPYLKPLFFQIRGWFVNIMNRLSSQSVSNKQTLLSVPLVNKEFVKGIDDKTKVLPDIRNISAQSDINGRILLADMLLAKRGKRQMYTSSADKQISLQEAQGYSLNIVDKFEAELKQAAFRSGISVQQLKINFQEVQSSVLKKVIAGNYHEISGVLYSYAEKAYPALEQRKKFSMFLKGGIEQMLQKEVMPPLNNTNIDNLSIGTDQAKALPMTNLNNVSIANNLTQLVM